MGFQLGVEGIHGDAELLEHRHRAPLRLPEQRTQDVCGLDDSVAPPGRQRLRLGERFLRADRELVHAHGRNHKHGTRLGKVWYPPRGCNPAPRPICASPGSRSA